MRPLPAPSKSLFKTEHIILLIGLFGFLIFLWVIAFLFLPLLSPRQAKPIALVTVIIQPTPTTSFVLPPTWTPGPTREVIPTTTGTPVYDGVIPTRVYTPRPTSLPGISLPFIVPKLTVLDLARIMQGESAGDLEAAYRVGWVAKNRLLHPSYGDTYADVAASGFWGYNPNINPRQEFLDLARRVIKARDDPTGGCLYALSRTDITNLGVPASRADVAYGEWFFFRVWPLNRG